MRKFYQKLDVFSLDSALNIRLVCNLGFCTRILCSETYCNVKHELNYR